MVKWETLKYSNELQGVHIRRLQNQFYKFYILLMEEIGLTTWDVKKKIANYGRDYLSTGAGFLPLTVALP